MSDAADISATAFHREKKLKEFLAVERQRLLDLGQPEEQAERGAREALNAALRRGL